MPRRRGLAIPALHSPVGSAAAATSPATQPGARRPGGSARLPTLDRVGSEVLMIAPAAGSPVPPSVDRRAHPAAHTRDRVDVLDGGHVAGQKRLSVADLGAERRGARDAPGASGSRATPSPSGRSPGRPIAHRRPAATRPATGAFRIAPARRRYRARVSTGRRMMTLAESGVRRSPRSRACLPVHGHQEWADAPRCPQGRGTEATERGRQTGLDFD